MKQYPNVIHEQITINEILMGKSIARFGDGEIKIIRGGNCVSQKYDKKCAIELNEILINNMNYNCLTGIPNIAGGKSPKEWFWEKYHKEERLNLYNLNKIYHSSFITRPDSAPWINTPEYWESVVCMWAGKRVMLVTGGRSSALRADTMPEAASVAEMRGMETNAYEGIDALEENLTHFRNTYDVVILCLGPTATCLAWRLSIKGIQALDLGHIAIYYRRWLKGEPMDAKHS